MILKRQTQFTITDKMVEAVADGLARFHGGNAILNLLEAEQLFHAAFANIDDGVESAIAPDMQTLEDWCFDRE